MYRTPKVGSLGLDSILLSEYVVVCILLRDLGITKLLVISGPRFSVWGRVATGYLHYYAVLHMLVSRGVQLRVETTSRLLLPSSLARVFRSSICQRITTLVSVYHLHWTSSPF